MKALYRKYRPTSLEAVVGQEQVTEVLGSALKAGKIGHAYLFVGPRGCGKTSVARIFAHEVNGFSYEVEDDYVDIIEIDGASNRGIDNIRELREKAAIAPTAGKYKVYIIDEVHMLTKEAFNALLKTLEEPPEHVIFIMATTDAYKVPVTITSRAQVFEFRLADAEVMFKHLRGICEKEGIKITDEALRLIVKRGGGSFRDSISLLDQISTLSDTEITEEMVVSALGLPSDVKITTLLKEVASGDVVKITTLLKELLSSGVKPETVAEEMIGAILNEPRAELLGLLSKLPEVKAPFAEAKLLVALVGEPSRRSPQEPAGVGGVSRSGARPASPSPRVAGATPRAAALWTPLRQETSATPAIMSAEKDALSASTTSATPITASSEKEVAGAPAQFDWEGFLEKVHGLNDAVWIYAGKCGHEARGGVLHLFPDKKVAKIILGKDNNKRILVDAAGMRVEIHEAGEKPKNVEKDALIDKISGIMGGEVLENGGSNPFE